MGFFCFSFIFRGPFRFSASRFPQKTAADETERRLVLGLFIFATCFAFSKAGRFVPRINGGRGTITVSLPHVLILRFDEQKNATITARRLKAAKSAQTVCFYFPTFRFPVPKIPNMKSRRGRLCRRLPEENAGLDFGFEDVEGNL